MRFLRLPVDQAEGCILAHSTRAATEDLALSQRFEMIPKGTRLTRAHIADMKREDVAEVQVACLEPGDITEDAAALQLAEALVEGRTGVRLTRPQAGRVNVVADHVGLAELNVQALNRMNTISPAMTVATVVPWKRMGEGGLIATIKIIPFAVPGQALTTASKAAAGAIGLAPPVFASATLIETQADREAPSDKGRRSTQGRLGRFGVMLSERVVVSHEEGAIAAALAEAPGEVLLILTETATSDVQDTAPSAVRRAGGDILHYGMPVDPGNLLFLGRVGDRPVIGLPGCARSPALNGADWVIERVICGAPIGPDEIMAMGVGGLLKEIPERGRPRN